MKHLLFLLLLFPIALWGQKPFKGLFFDKDNNINLNIDFYEESVEVPGLSFLGKTNGYMNGNIFGIWMVTSFKIKNNKATVNLSNDMGSDSQTIILIVNEKNELEYQTVGTQCIKKVVNRKLIKIPDSLHFILKTNN